jgi:TonB family protein
VLVGADGTVKQVKISGGGLPDGLNEEAIQAAKQMRFQPAMKNGEKVAYWVTIEIEFNLR